MRVFSYKIVRDFGFAPNPFAGVCTLANCKPQIRSQANPGDLIIGCGSSALKMEGRIIFVMRVAEKLTFDEYWQDPRFQIKKPVFTLSRSRAYGDNIYTHDAKGVWTQADSHHSLADGRVNMANLQRDTGSNSVLIGNDFIYWGGNAITIPAGLRNFEGTDIYPPRRSHRSIFSDNFVKAVDAWFTTIDYRGVHGRPASWP